MVICLEQCADLHMARLIPLPLTVSCFTKIQIGFTFLVPAHPGTPGHRGVKRACVCVCIRPSPGKALSAVARDQHVILYNLAPATSYEFKVRTVKGTQTSLYSAAVTNTTFETGNTRTFTSITRL